MNLLTKQEGLNYRIEGKTLILEHSGHAKIRSWSIFDISGAEKCNGKFAEVDPNTIDITCLAPGVYEVCLMDDEKLRSARFKIASPI